MNNEEYFEKMASIQQKIEIYFNQEEDDDAENDDIKEQILEDRLIFKSALSLLSKLAKNHCRPSHFLSKIRKIFHSIKADILENFSNSDIFDIFKNQKLILLFLIEEKIIFIDKTISDIILNGKYDNFHYPEFFYPEIKQFIDELTNQDILASLPQDFEKIRQKGENEEYICQLIREDSVKEFIIFVNKYNYNLNSLIKTSIFETNSFLLKKVPTLIEYAAFYGSVQILKYLFLNNVSISPSLWFYAIHSNNPEIIHFLEEQEIKPEDETYEKCLEESIKCHHNEIADYFLYNFINEEDKCNFNNNVYSYGFHYRNFLYFPKDQNNRFSFYYACRYNYINIVENFLKNKNFDINEKIIKQIILFNENILLCFLYDSFISCSRRK